jgi:hypothetical protein
VFAFRSTSAGKSGWPPHGSRRKTARPRETTAKNSRPGRHTASVLLFLAMLIGASACASAQLSHSRTASAASFPSQSPERTVSARECPWGTVIGQWSFAHPNWGESTLVSCSNVNAPSGYGCSMQIFASGGSLKYENQDGIIGCQRLSVDASGLPTIEGSYDDGEPWRQRMTFDPNYPDVADGGFAWEPVG